MGAACWWLEALHARVVAHVMAAERVFADDTPLPVLEPSCGRTKTGRLWVYTRDDRPFGGMAPPVMAFTYAPDRRGARPATQLGSFRGILQVDGFACFEALAADGTIALAACWSHVRRKFYELHEAGSPVPDEALSRIVEIYRLEASIRGRPPDECQDVRAPQARPGVDTFRSWLDVQLGRLQGWSRLAEAI